MRNTCVAHHEVGIGGRRNRRNRMNAEPITLRADVAAANPETKVTPEELEMFTEKLVKALKTVYDPEIPVDIYELGLICKLDVADTYDTAVDMTLTAPGCPVAGGKPPRGGNARGSE